MNIIGKVGMFRQKSRGSSPTYVVLHHTAGEGLVGAEQTLKARGYGYHYIIDRKGDVHHYVNVRNSCSHATGYNAGSIGISFIGGSSKPEGACNEEQLKALSELLRKLKEEVSTLKYITGHKHINNIGKYDPQFPGEKGGVVNHEIDRKYMTRIATETGLVFKKVPV